MRTSAGMTKAYAASRDGVVTVAQLRAAGVSVRCAERAVARGEWQRPARATYVTHAGELEPMELARVAAAYAGQPCLVTGLVALHLLGLRWLPPLTEAHALVPHQVRRPSSGMVQVTRTTGFEVLASWRAGGVAMAWPERAVVDASRACRSLREVRGIVLGAVADGCASAEGLREVLDAGRRNGSGVTRRVIGDAVRGCASPPEAELVDALVGSGRPFLVNPEVWLEGRLLGRPDVWMVGTAVGGEVDSVERHGSAMGVTATYDRHERFATAGLELVHLSVARIRGDAGEAAAHLLRRSREAARPVPAGLVVRPLGPVLS